MSRLFERVLAGCIIIFAMSAQSMADALSDAQRAFDAGDYAQAATLYLPLAKQGNAVAQYSLGVVYTQGLVVLPDYREAMQWYLLAADQGHAPAQVKLGMMYAQGKWVPQNYRKAVQMFQSAADRKDALGELNLGDMYAQGHGVLQDVQKAIEWYQRAADQGNALAQYKLGQIYSDGREVAQNNETAYMWFNLASANATDDASHAKYIERRDWAARQLAAQILLKAQQEADARAKAERDAVAAQLPPASLSETAPENVRPAEAQAEPDHRTPPTGSKSRSVKKRKAVLAKDGLKGKDGRAKPKAKTAYIKVKIIPDKTPTGVVAEDAAAKQQIGEPAGIINTAADHAPETSPPVALEQAAPVTAEAPGVEAGQVLPATTEAPKVEVQQAAPATAETPGVEGSLVTPAATEAPKVEMPQVAPPVEAPGVEAGQVTPVATEAPKAEVQQAAPATAEVSNVGAGIVAPPSSEAVPEAEIKPKASITEETAGAIINPPPQ
ncbi:MAG: SEL1-like repeat protein [Nitrosomonadales bacterium]|nr:SEL1-like repeat protein [Nitrosomonadales bacterium]